MWTWQICFDNQSAGFVLPPWIQGVLENCLNLRSRKNLLENSLNLRNLLENSLNFTGSDMSKIFVGKSKLRFLSDKYSAIGNRFFAVWVHTAAGHFRISTDAFGNWRFPPVTRMRAAMFSNSLRASWPLFVTFAFTSRCAHRNAWHRIFMNDVGRTSNCALLQYFLNSTFTSFGLFDNLRIPGLRFCSIRLSDCVLDSRSNPILILLLLP